MARGGNSTADAILYGGGPRLHHPLILSDYDPRWEFPKLDEQSLLSLAGTTGYAWKDALRHLYTTEKADQDAGETLKLDRLGISHDQLGGRLWIVNRMLVDYGFGKETDWQIWYADRYAQQMNPLRPDPGYPKIEGADMVFECHQPTASALIRIRPDGQMLVSGVRMHSLDQ